jgi:hypothetical protein
VPIGSDRMCRKGFMVPKILFGAHAIQKVPKILFGAQRFCLTR